MINTILNILKKVKSLTPFVSLGALVLAFVLYLLDFKDLMDSILFFVLLVFSIPLWYEIVSSIARKHFGVDLVAGLALLSALVFDQYTPGVIVLLMLSGGEALESYAMNRAKRALQGLLNLIPPTVHIKTKNGVVSVDINSVSVGMEIVVKAGEVIPVDGVVVEGDSYVDESVMTGESLPVHKKIESFVLAGTTNSDAALLVRSTKSPSESRLSGIIEMVRKAEEEKAPFVRMADKYSVYFTTFTILMAGLAYFISGDPVRMLAVLVVATPCPLILATPIAFMSGMSRASKKGIIVKNGGALEALASVDMGVFDKTGTITVGVPKIYKVKSFHGMKEGEVLSTAASLDQLSVHVFAKSLVSYAQENNLKLRYPSDFKELFGDGVSGKVGDENFYFGKLKFLKSFGISTIGVSEEDGVSIESGVVPVYLGNKDKVVGVIYFKDEIRPEAKKVFSDLSFLGIKRFMLLSGDKDGVARAVASSMKINEYKAECLPDEKLSVIKDLQKSGLKVAMIGDGVNDAPALTQSDVGIALGAHGGTTASDSADMVVVSGSIEKIPDAYKIAKRTVRVAREGIFIGIGLSVFFMFFALFGKLPPLYGALIQEGIDIIVILYALRAGRDIV